MSAIVGCINLTCQPCYWDVHSLLAGPHHLTPGPACHLSLCSIYPIPSQERNLGWCYSEQICRSRYIRLLHLILPIYSVFVVFKTIDAYAPNFSQSVIGRDILTPPDLERIIGLTGGVSYDWIWDSPSLMNFTTEYIPRQYVFRSAVQSSPNQANFLACHTHCRPLHVWQQHPSWYAALSYAVMHVHVCHHCPCRRRCDG